MSTSARAEYMRDWRRRNPGREANYHKAWEARHPEWDAEAYKAGWYQQNRTAVLARNAKHDKSPESRKVRAAWRDANPQRIALYETRRHQRHGDKRRAANRERYKANPQQAEERSRRRRGRIVGCEAHFTAQEWQELKVRFGFTCLCCLKKEPEIKLTPDHVIPLAKGGTDDIGNIQPLCGGCNSKKFTKTTDYRSDFGHG